ncbi:MAG: aminotransferase class V-fold PLP-dependent enzyme [Actinobacteria bacterium]|nr:aminotransferase class V-fold PLP-dependent enzyme [Actinomycetota bacterium]
MKENIVYFDNSATSWPKPKEVLESIKYFIDEIGGSPGRSGHRMSIEASRLVEETREVIGEFFNYDDTSRIVFTKNITEALNVCIFSLLKPGDHVITSSIEHNSVMRPLRFLEKKGLDISTIYCSPKGDINVSDIEKNINNNTKLVILTHASNVLGTILPIEKVAEITYKYKIPFVIDCAQTAGSIPVNINLKKYKNCIITFTGHKSMLGPTGTGGMCIGEDVELMPIIFGGTGSKSDKDIQPDFLPDYLESGTLNVMGLAGLKAAVSYLLKIGLNNIRNHEKLLLSKFIEGASEIKNVIIYGSKDPETQVGLISFNFKNINSSTAGLILDKKYSIMCRIGLHCNPNAHKVIGTFPEGTIRFSFSYFNSLEEINYSINALNEMSKIK